ERCADRLDLRHRAHARERVLGLSAHPELRLSARDVRRGAVGDEAQGGAGGGDPDVPSRGHSCHCRWRGDQRILAHHGLQLSEDRAGGSMALRIAVVSVLLLLTAGAAWAENATRMAMARVRLTTDPKVPIGCTTLGT